MDISRYNTDTTMKKRVLQIIYERGYVSRNELIEILNLSLTSVVKFVSALIDDGVVIESGTQESTGGRRTKLLSINPEYCYILGVDIGGYAAKIGVVRMDGSIVEDWFIRAADVQVPVQGIDLDGLINRVGEIFGKYGKGKFLAICVGISGLVDHTQGKVIFCPNLAGWDNVPLGDALRDAFGLPVFVDTSVRCMALAEQRYGAGQGVANQLFVSMGNYGISSALIIDSKLYRGGSGFAGEIGHVMSSDRGERCTCGNYDCLELTATLYVIVQNIRDRLAEYRGFSPLKQILAANGDTQLTPATILQAVEAGDKLCYETIMSAGVSTGTALANLLNVLNPEIVVLGGGVIEFFPLIIDMINNTIKERVLVTVQQNLQVRQAKMDWRGAVIGSTLMAVMEFFK